MEAAQAPELPALNKIDIALTEWFDALQRAYPEALAVSAGAADGVPGDASGHGAERARRVRARRTPATSIESPHEILVVVHCPPADHDATPPSRRAEPGDPGYQQQVGRHRRQHSGEVVTSVPRRWTQAGTVGTAAHVFYELGAGVGMPFASRLGPAPAATVWALSSAAAFREAGRQPPSRDPAFAVLNGMFLAAVIAHFAAWPRTRRAGLPWLTECEGLRGREMVPYNLILYQSGLSAMAALVLENRRSRVWGALVPVVLVPLLMSDQHREYGRLRSQARRRPRWWNRRLAR